MSNVEFIISAYNRPNHLMMAINCIYAQTATNWKVTVVADAPFDGLDKVKGFFEGDDRIRFHTIEGGPHKDWGNTARMWGIANSTEEWIVMTGDDNYYFPVFLESMNAAMTDKTQFIFCDMYHNYANYVYEKSELRKIVYPDNSFRFEGMDIGAFASKSEYARQVTYYPKWHCADGAYAAEYWEKFCKDPESIVRIPRGLYVHN